MKGISTILEVIMLVIIVAALIFLLWLFSRNLFSSVSGTGKASIDNTLKLATSCMRIVTTGGNKIILKNCGTGVIESNSLQIFIDNVPFDFNVTPSSIGENGLATISIHVWGISVGDHNLMIIGNYTQIEKTITASLPDSCVLALDFDEGSETIAYDKSTYHNDGTLGNSSIWTHPTWADGKFGKALSFDGNDFIQVPNTSSLNISGTITVAAWVKSSDVSPCNIISTKTKNPGSDPTDIANWYLWTVGGSLNFMVYKEGTQYTAGMPISANVWQYVVGTYDGSAVRAWVNGVSGTPVSLTGTIDTVNESVLIGTRNVSYDYFNGIMDSVRVCNKALTPDETVILKLK